MRSVDRVFKFIDLPSETAESKPDQSKGSDLIIQNKDARTDATWPSHGQIDVRNLTVKYTEAGHAVLKNLSFNVEGGQRVRKPCSNLLAFTELIQFKLRFTLHLIKAAIQRSLREKEKCWVKYTQNFRLVFQYKCLNLLT